MAVLEVVSLGFGPEVEEDDDFAYVVDYLVWASELEEVFYVLEADAVDPAGS